MTSCLAAAGEDALTMATSAAAGGEDGGGGEDTCGGGGGGGEATCGGDAIVGPFGGDLTTWPPGPAP